MSKLPPKPMNIVHEYFPVGTDGHSPMNYIDKDVPLNKNGKTYSERMKDKIYGKNPIVEDPDNPDQVIRKDDIPPKKK